MPGLQLSSTVLAYLDPGTGSMLLQGVLAAIAAIAMMLKLFWHRILAFLKIGPPRKVTASNASVGLEGASGAGAGDASDRGDGAEQP